MFFCSEPTFLKEMNVFCEKNKKKTALNRHTCKSSSCKTCKNVKDQRRQHRNGRERFRNLKLNLAYQQLRNALPLNPQPGHSNGMSTVQVLENALVYIGILNQTLLNNDTTQAIATEMRQQGFVTSAEEFLADETRLQQNTLDQRMKFLFRRYGMATPEKTIKRAPKDYTKTLDEILTVIDMSETTTPLRVDSAGELTDPLMIEQMVDQGIM